MIRAIRTWMGRRAKVARTPEEPSVGAQPTPSPYLVLLPDIGRKADAQARSFSAGIASFLEMYGLVGANVCTAKEAVGALRAAQRCVVFVCSRADWSPIEADLDLIMESAACVFIEGPISHNLARRLGLDLSEQRAVTEHAARICDSKLRDRVAASLAGYCSTDPLSLAPIRVWSWRTYGSAKRADWRETDVVSPFHDPPAINQTFRAPAGPVLALNGSPQEALLTRCENVLVSSFSILGLIAQRLGVARLGRPMCRVSGERNGESLDHVLLHLVADTARDNGFPLITVEPWPFGVSHVVSVRHDVDRRVSEPDWVRLRRWQDEAGIRASWYFLASTLDPGRMAELAGAGHELGYHYTNLEKAGERELAALRSHMPPGSAVVGAACHGGNFHGQSDLDWLAARGFGYGEILTRCSLFPFRPVTYEARASACDIMSFLVSARHMSVDRSLSPPVADFSHGEHTRDARIRCGAQAVIMNHPDINFDAMRRAVTSFMTPRSEVWTQVEAVTWWRATHVAGHAALTVRPLGDTLEVRLAHGASRLPALRVWGHAEAADAHAVDNLGARHTVLPAPTGGGVRIRFGGHGVAA